MRAILVFLLALTLVGAVWAECEDACANGYAAFRQWCLAMGQSAPCTSLVNAPRQFNTQSCLRFCVR